MAEVGTAPEPAQEASVGSTVASEPREDRAAAFQLLPGAATPGPGIAVARLLLERGVIVPLVPLVREMIARWPDDAAVGVLHDDVMARAAQLQRSGAAAADVARSPPKIRKALADIRKSGHADEVALASDFAFRTYPEHSWALESLLRVFNGARSFERALAAFDAAPAATRATPEAMFLTYTAAYRSDSPRRAALRASAMEVIATADHTDLWTGRLLRLENDPAAALDAFVRAVRDDPDNMVAVREVATLGLTLGRIGEHAAHVLRAEASAPPDLQVTIRGARDLLVAAGGSLEQAAAGEAPWASLTSPAAAFDLVCADPGSAAYQPASRLMMIGGSLAAGGAERILATLFAAYRRALGPDAITLVLLECAADAPTAFYLPQTGVDIAEILIGRVAQGSDRKILWLPKPMAIRTQAIYDHILATRPAVVHATLDMANICGAYAALLAGVPRIVLHLHNMRPTELAVAGAYNPDYDRCYRALLQRAEVHLVAVSQATLDDYLDWIDVPASDRTHVIHNGFDFAEFDRGGAHAAAVALRDGLGIAADAPLVGTAFRFAELKRPDWWVRIAAQVAARRPDAHFILFGDGDLLEDTRALAASLGLDGRIHFPGRVGNLGALIGALDLFMLTSRTEGLPNVLIEAQAAGVPVVSFDVGGARDTFADGVTGRLVAEQSVAAMTEAVCDMLQDRERLIAAGEAARAYVRERFPVARMVDELAIVLGDLQ